MRFIVAVFLFLVSGCEFVPAPVEPVVTKDARPAPDARPVAIACGVNNAACSATLNADGLEVVVGLDTDRPITIWLAPLWRDHWVGLPGVDAYAYVDEGRGNYGELVGAVQWEQATPGDAWTLRPQLWCPPDLCVGDLAGLRFDVTLTGH